MKRVGNLFVGQHGQQIIKHSRRKRFQGGAYARRVASVINWVGFWDYLTFPELRSCYMSDNFNVDQGLFWIVKLGIQDTWFESKKVPYIHLCKHDDMFIPFAPFADRIGKWIGSFKKYITCSFVDTTNLHRKIWPNTSIPVHFALFILPKKNMLFTYWFQEVNMINFKEARSLPNKSICGWEGKLKCSVHQETPKYSTM